MIDFLLTLVLVLCATAVGVVAVPVVVFLSCKLGRYGWLAATYQFEQDKSQGKVREKYYGKGA